MYRDYVRLNRNFSKLGEDIESEKEILSNHDKKSKNLWCSNHEVETTWEELLKKKRVVVLAEAGSGKTYEFYNTCLRLRNDDKFAFFARIEDLSDSIKECFEQGTPEELENWLDSKSSAWFFLDSVDEAKLRDSNSFRKAISKFKNVISKGLERSHIFISTRLYSWKGKVDKSILENLNPSASQLLTNNQYAVEAFVINPLNEEQIKKFCSIKKSLDKSEINHFYKELKELNLIHVSERPFDLNLIISKWEKDKVLGNRKTLLESFIDNSLKEDFFNDEKKGLPYEKAKDGSRKLAAAMVLTGSSWLQVSGVGIINNKNTIDPKSILIEWEHSDLNILLNSAMFNDVVYGKVSFRHQEIKEFLAAEYFANLFTNDEDSMELQSLFITDIFDEKIVRPCMRSVLPWLILMNASLQTKVLEIAPQILIEGGDPRSLDFQSLDRFLDKILNSMEDGNFSFNNLIFHSKTGCWNGHHHSVKKHFQRLLDKKNEIRNAGSLLIFLTSIVRDCNLIECLPFLKQIILNETFDDTLRGYSIEVVFSFGDQDLKEDIWKQLSVKQSINEAVFRELIYNTTPNIEILNSFLKLRLTVKKRNNFLIPSLNEICINFIEKLNYKYIPDAFTLFHNDYKATSETEFKKHSRVLALICIKMLIKQKHEIALGHCVINILIDVYNDDSFCRQNNTLIDSISVEIEKWEDMSFRFYFYFYFYLNKITFVNLNLKSFKYQNFSNFFIWIETNLMEIDSNKKNEVLLSMCYCSDNTYLMFVELKKNQLNPDLDEIVNRYFHDNEESINHINDKEVISKHFIDQENNERKNLDYQSHEKELSRKKILSDINTKNRKINQTHISLSQCFFNKDINSDILVLEYGHEIAKAFENFCISFWRESSQEELSQMEHLSYDKYIAYLGTEFSYKNNEDFNSLFKPEDISLYI